MNPYRMAPPPRWWAPVMKPVLVCMFRPLRRRRLIRVQRLRDVQVEGIGHLRQSLAQGQGVLITPNHATHADPDVVYVVADRVGCPFYFMSTPAVLSDMDYPENDCRQLALLRRQEKTTQGE